MRNGTPVAQGALKRLAQGEVDVVSPSLGDIHRVCNAHDDRVSISVHVYGGNIGGIQRSVYSDGQRRPFVSGYANKRLPNFWD
jgi:predicted metal-dependent enzyme (double-stranded beta helix superfamily)